MAERAARSPICRGAIGPVWQRSDPSANDGFACRASARLMPQSDFESGEDDEEEDDDEDEEELDESALESVLSFCLASCLSAPSLADLSVSRLRLAVP